MKDKILDTIYGKISYTTNNVITKYGFITYLTLEFIKDITPSDIYTYNTKIIYVVGGYSLASILLKTKEHTKEVREILSLYKEFLNNYKVLNEDLDMSSPYKINALFNYLLYNGYLSYNNEFELDENSKCLSNLRGAYIISGTSNSKGIHYMFSDILNILNIENYNIDVYKPQDDIFVLDDNNEEEIIKKYFSRNEEDIVKGEYINPNSLKDRIMGNIFINISSYNGKSYIINPVNGKKIEAKKDNIKYIFSEMIKLSKRKRIDEIIAMPSSLESIGSISYSDRLGKFREENKELYKEINNKVKKIRR